MAVEKYKKFIMIGFIALFAVIVVFAMITSSPYKPQRETQRSALSPGPLLDANANQIMPPEEPDVDRNDPKALALLGDKYFESGNFNQAIEIYKRVLELNPDDIDTHNDLGLAYHYMKRSNLAVDSLKKGIDVEPSFQRIRLSLGFVLMSSGRNAEAKDVLEQAAELDPDSTVGKEAKRMAAMIQW